LATTIVGRGFEHSSKDLGTTRRLDSLDAARRAARENARNGPPVFRGRFIAVRIQPWCDRPVDPGPRWPRSISAFRPARPWSAIVRVVETVQFANATVFRLAQSDAKLLQLEELARTTFEAMGLSGYARVDFRVDAEGPWILEVNTNPCISPDAGFAAALAQSGIRYKDAIARIVRAALHDAGS
jgi:hypothetical protein